MWVSITGLPAHAWKENVFRSLVASVGTFVALDESTSKKLRMDVGRVLLLVSSREVINKLLKIKINKFFSMMSGFLKSHSQFLILI